MTLMLPPLNIEIPDSPARWSEAESLRDVQDTDRLSPTASRMMEAENLEHTIQIRISCLSGITANRPMCRDISKSSTAAPPPQHMKAMVAIFRNSEPLGSTSFSQPLTLSSSRMFADDDGAVNRYMALWQDSSSSALSRKKNNSKPGSLLEFQMPLCVSGGGMVHPEELELLVFLADHSGDGGRNVVAYPIGLGSFVVGGDESNKNVDLRIKYVCCRSGFPAMEIKFSETPTPPSPSSHSNVSMTSTKSTSIKFTNASGSKLSKAVAATYKFDKRGGGFLRMTVDWRSRGPAERGLSTPSPITAPLEHFHNNRKHKNVFTAAGAAAAIVVATPPASPPPRENIEEARSTGSHGEQTSPEEVNLQRSSNHQFNVSAANRQTVNYQAVEEEQRQQQQQQQQQEQQEPQEPQQPQQQEPLTLPEHEIPMADDESEVDEATSVAVEKMFSSLKFPSRSPARSDKKRNVQSTTMEVVGVQIGRVDPEHGSYFQHNKKYHEDKRQDGLQYKIGKRKPTMQVPLKSEGSFKFVPTPSLSFDDESLLHEFQAHSQGSSFFSPRSTSPSGVLSKEGEKTTTDSHKSTYNIVDRILQLLESLTLCGSSPNFRSDVSVAGSKLSFVDTWNTFEEDDNKTLTTFEKSHVGDNDATFLEEFIDSTWKAFDDDVRRPVQRVQETVQQITAARKKRQARSLANVSTSPTFWAEVQEAQSSLCITDNATVESGKPKKTRRRTRGRQRRQWV